MKKITMVVAAATLTMVMFSPALAYHKGKEHQCTVGMPCQSQVERAACDWDPVWNKCRRR